MAKAAGTIFKTLVFGGVVVGGGGALVITVYPEIASRYRVTYFRL
jgi:hypothetical protein